MMNREELIKTVVGHADEKRLLCPCGFDFVHPTFVKVHRGNEIHTINKYGYEESSGPLPGRGVLIELGFSCEHGHLFSTKFSFYKGNTYVEVIESGEACYSGSLDTLWRD